MLENGKDLKEKSFFVKGMHCASCAILIETKVKETEGIEDVKVLENEEKIIVSYQGEEPTKETLNALFQKENYLFSEYPTKKTEHDPSNSFSVPFATAFLIILGFLLLNSTGLGGAISLNSKSSLPMFFVLGIVAGVSTCSALLGGIVVSLTNPKNNNNSNNSITRLSLFCAGRTISYAFFGALLGFLGNRIKLSPELNFLLVIAVSLTMIIFGLQMLGVKILTKLRLPGRKIVSNYVSNQSNVKNRFASFLLGASTFFLPCGFTLTAQGLALLSGSSFRGSLMLFLFSLGTLPMILSIGFSSIKLSKSPRFSFQFAKTAGFLLLFFAIFNINSQIKALDLNQPMAIKPGQTESPEKPNNNLPPLVNGKQVLKMDASASGYKPNYFKVAAGLPVRFEITDKGTSGCTNAVISRELFEGEISLTPGQTSIKEFTPTKPGKFKFSCWMGMVSGTIEVVDKNKI